MLVDECVELALGLGVHLGDVLTRDDGHGDELVLGLLALEVADGLNAVLVVVDMPLEKGTRKQAISGSAYDSQAEKKIWKRR